MESYNTSSSEKKKIEVEQFDASVLSHNEEPEDKGNVAYYLMLLFGVGALLPWNAILTALDFFIEHQKDYKPDFVFGFAVNSCLTFVQVFIIVQGHKFSYVVRITGGFLFIALLMIVIPLVTQYLDAKNGFIACMITLIFFGAAGGIVQGSIFGLAGMLPGKFIGAVMFGNGLSGLSINIMRAFCLAIFPPKEGSDNAFYGALVYFILAAILLIVSAIGFLYFIKLPVIQYYIRKATAEKMKSFRRVSAADLDHPGLGGESIHGNSLLEINKSGMHTQESSSLLEGDKHGNLGLPSPVETRVPRINHPAHSPMVAFLLMMKRSLQVAWLFLCTLTMVFVITFVVFPGVSLQTNLVFLESIIDDPKVRGSWNALIFIFTFNVMDTFGRWLGGQPFAFGSDKFVIALTYARMVFIATFMLIAFGVPPDWLFGSGSDWFKILNMMLFAATNGYCSTQCAIKSPSRAPDDSKEQVGNLIGVFLTLGIMLGSILAIGMGSIKFS